MNLGEALDAALTAQFRVRGVRSAVTSTRGFRARLKALEKAGKGERGAAEMAGVTLKTWRAWKSGTKPTKRSLEKLADAHERNLRSRKATKAQTMFTPRVSAEIEWNGYYNATAYRSTQLEPLDLTAVIAAWTVRDLEEMASVFKEAVQDEYGVPVEFEGNVIVEL